MAKIRQLAELFKAISAHDWKHAEFLAEALIAEEARAGHHGAVARLRGALRPNGHRTETLGSGSAAIPLVGGALTEVGPGSSLADVELRPAQRATLEAVVAECMAKAALKRHGLGPRTKLLFHGPPGCGKTYTATALGRELDVPTYVVRFDAIVGAYLGQTALRLRQLFRFAASTACVLVIDEVDALARRRGNPQDVGELDRVVIALMQELEHTEPAGLIVASSNIPRELDDALWRRFNANVAFPLPTQPMLRKFAAQERQRRSLPRSKALGVRLKQAKSYADVVGILDDEQRSRIVQQKLALIKTR